MRLIPLLLIGAALIGAALWLRTSRWLREDILRGKDLPELETAVRAQPDDPVARYYLAKSYYLRRRFSEARAAYEEAIRLDPSSARAHLGLALALYEDGEIRQAREEFDETLRCDGRSAWAEYMLGKIAWLEGRLGTAVPHLQRATALDPRSDPAWYGLGICYIQLQRYNEGISALQQALTRRESSPQYHTALGEIQVFRGDTEEGRRHLERALQLKPDYGPACGLMGSYYLYKSTEPNRLDRADEFLQRAAQHPTYHPETVFLDLGQLYLQKGKYKEAVAALHESIHKDPRDEQTYYALANVYRRMGNTAEAAAADREFRRISDLHVQMQTVEARVVEQPGNAPERLKMARLCRDLGLIQKAVGQYDAYLRLQPHSPEVTRELEQMLQQQASIASAQHSDFGMPSP